jgi:uracil-DNA glycosylase
MKINAQVNCPDRPCTDVRTAGHWLPAVDLDPEGVRMVLIAEAPPQDPSQGFYELGDALFARTTLLAFSDAGLAVASVQELLERGIYLTTAVKCPKTAYGIATATVQHCSHLLEQELALFPNIQVYLLMGDVAIKAINAIARRQGHGRIIPAGSTYKIRSGEFFYHGRRVFPSYLQAGPAFFIEKTKRQAIAEDIAAALSLVGIPLP